MNHRAKTLLVAAATTAASLGFYVTQSTDVAAADHNDPVAVQASGPRLPGGTVEVHSGDPAADLADMFAWHTEDKLILILSWRTDAANAQLDPDLVYGIHIDNDRDFSPADPANINIWIRYGQNAQGEWGQKVEGLPGIDGKTVYGRVGDVIEERGIVMTTNVFDDPFAFDLDGFFNGLSVALGNEAPAEPTALRDDRPFGFDNRNDSFAGTNVGAFVAEIPLSYVYTGHDELHVWGTSRAPEGSRNR